MDKTNYLTALSRYIHLDPIRTKRIQVFSVPEKEQYLKKYRWSSLPGYLNKKKKVPFINYDAILSLCGGNRRVYWKQICNDLTIKMDIEEKVVGQSILGNDTFINWVKERFLTKDPRELPQAGKIFYYKTKDEIIKIICEETRKEITEIIKEKGPLRQLTMELLYRLGGLNGREIGKMMGIDYSTVSRERKKLKQRLVRDKSLLTLKEKIETKLSMANIRLPG